MQQASVSCLLKPTWPTGGQYQEGFADRIAPELQKTRSSAVAERLRDASCHWMSLKITQGHSNWHCWVGCVLVPISIFIETICMSYRFWHIQHQKTAWLWNWGRGHSRSLKMEPIDRSCDFLLVAHCKYSCILYHFQVIWRWKGHWRSFKLVPFESLGAVSYLPSIVNMAVSLTVYEIFNIKVYRDLENWVRCCSRSLKMALFDRLYDILLVRRCKYSFIWYHFWVIWR